MESEQSLRKRELQQEGERSIQTEQVLISHNRLIPSADELAKLKEIDPDFPKFFMKTAEREQEARHRIQDEGMNDLRAQTRLDGRGMNFALVSVILFVLLTAFALWLNRPWFAGIFTFMALFLIIRAFLMRGEQSK